MTTSHWAGPHVVFGVSSGVPTPDYNPDLGTSLFWGSVGLLDQRITSYWNYTPGNLNYRGWQGADSFATLNFIPASLATGNITNNVVPTTALPLVLVTAAAVGITPGASVTNAGTGVVVNGLLLLDGLTASVVGSISGQVFTAASVNNGNLTVGSVLSGSGNTSVQPNTVIIAMGGHAGTTGAGGVGTYIVSPGQIVSAQITITAVAGINGVPVIPGNIQSIVPTTTSNPPGTQGPLLYNAQCMFGRNVRLLTQSGDTAVYTVRGFDIYGYPMTEAITANGAASVSGKKAFKYIQSVTPVGTVGAAASIGTGDVYGFPLFSLSFQDVAINWGTTGNSGLVTANTGYLAGDLTNPAISTTGDPRGTYAVQTASNGATRLTVKQSPQSTQVSSIFGLFGVTPA